MTKLCYCEIARELPLPDFGEAFRRHMLAKTHPKAYAASLSAWNLLGMLLRENGYTHLPEAAFLDTGKPYFPDCSLHFSLSHSANLAAAVISEKNCAADIELIRPDVQSRLTRRCLSEQEIAAGCDFFDVWTKKECIAKLDGQGLPGHPICIDTLDEGYKNRFFTQRIFDSSGNEYALTALGEGLKPAEKRSII